MPEDFDAYYRWLGIPPKDQPPHHYRLLALEVFESDPDVIEAAADRQMGFLRTYQAGKRAALSQKLLNEVAAAKVCLLNSPKKAAYDATLREQLAPAAPPQASARPGSGTNRALAAESGGIDPAVAGLIERADAAALRGARPVVGRPTGRALSAGWSWGLAIAVFAVGVAVFVLIIAMTIRPKGSAEPAAEKGLVASKAPARPTPPRPSPDDGAGLNAGPAAKPDPGGLKPNLPEPSLPEPKSEGPNGVETKKAGQDQPSGGFGMPPKVASPEPKPDVPLLPFESPKEPAKTGTQPPASEPKVPTDEKSSAKDKEPSPFDEPAAGKKGATQPRPEAKKELRAYEGTWIISFAETGKGRRYVVDGDGGVTWGAERGQLAKRDKDTVIEFGDGSVDRVKLVRGKAPLPLVVEHFDRKEDYPNRVSWNGHGRRLPKTPAAGAARLPRALHGDWIVRYADKPKTVRGYEINVTNGTVDWANIGFDRKGKVNRVDFNKRGQVTVQNGEIVLDFQDGTLERLELYEGGLWVEQFRTSADYPHSISVFGLGMR